MNNHISKYMLYIQSDQRIYEFYARHQSEPTLNDKAARTLPTNIFFLY